MLKAEKILSLGLWLVMVGFAVWGHFSLPDAPMAVHFDLHGVANGYKPRDMVLSVFPAITLLVMILTLWILPAIMPKSGSIERSAGAYGAIMLTMFACFTLGQAVLVLSAAGFAMDHVRLVFTGIGTLFIVMGNYLPKTRKNWLMGIRSPWTLSDERVWDRTHRVAGPLVMAGGVLILLSTWCAPAEWRAPTFVVSILVAFLGSYAYSYFVARKLDLV